MKKNNIDSDRWLIISMLVFASVPLLIGRLFGYGRHKK